MPISSIDEVVLTLRSIVEECRQKQSKAGFFAALYLRMTEAVKEGISNHQFENAKLMEQLDICFAERYISAYQAYGAKQKCTRSWKLTFDSCGNNDNIVLQHLLMGINTHINLDLAIAAATVAPGESIHRLEKDFNRINDIIATLSDDVQECLTKIWFPMRLVTRIMNGKQEAVLNFSITKARQTSWANAVLLANMIEVQKLSYIDSMDSMVEKVGRAIQSPGFWINILLKIIRRTEYNNISRTITLIETIKV